MSLWATMLVLPKMVGGLDGIAASAHVDLSSTPDIGVGFLWSRNWVPHSVYPNASVLLIKPTNSMYSVLLPRQTHFCDDPGVLNLKFVMVQMWGNLYLDTWSPAGVLFGRLWNLSGVELH